jgi:hypothetical protein
MMRASATAMPVFPNCGHLDKPGNRRNTPDGVVCRCCTRPDRGAFVRKDKPRRAYFCERCERGGCHHVEPESLRPCLAPVAPAPLDFACACGARRPVRWRTMLMDPTNEWPANRVEKRLARMAGAIK